MEMMNQPRCGMADNMGYSNAARRKRYAAMQNVKWPINDLTWRMNSYSNDLPDADIRDIMQRALEVRYLNFIKLLRIQNWYCVIDMFCA